MEFVTAVKALARAKQSDLDRVTQVQLERWGLQKVQLRQHQLEGVTWLAERCDRSHGCILGDEMGLGKTLQAVALMVYLREARRLPGPFLVLCPLSVVSGWEFEITRAAPHLTILNYCSGKEEREQIQQQISQHIRSTGKGWKGSSIPFDILLAHYEVVLKDASFLQRLHWECLIVDEGHRLKNSSSLLHRALREFDVGVSILLTGTPVQNNLDELYSLLSFVAPSVFPISKLKTFVECFLQVKEDKQVATRLHSVLEPFLLRRTKSEVLLDLPVKSEVILYTALSALQKKMYKAILTKDLEVFGEASSRTRLMNILVQLRKCINHPYLFDGVEPEPFELGEHLVETSGKLFVIDKLLEFLKPRGHRVLLFSQMTRMLDIIQDYLGYRGYSYERLDGSVRGEERFLAVQKFTEDEETFVFLLSTRAGGQGLNLAGADTVIFVDPDFNPQNDLQAAARAHRLGQTRPVKVMRLVCRDTAEEIILRRAESKLNLTSTVIEGGQFSHSTAVPGGVGNGSSQQLADILKFGLDRLLQSEEETGVCEDLESVLGRTEDGKWVIETGNVEEEEVEEVEEEGNIYMYEGRDYSRSSDQDRKAFDQLLAEQLRLTEQEIRTRVLRSEQHTPLAAELPVVRKRKPLSDEQLAERRRKHQEAKEKRLKKMADEEQRREEERRRRRLEWWRENHYTSLNVHLDSSSEEEEEEEEEEEKREGEEIQYVIGDVTHPQHTGTRDALIVHCVDDSGRWGKGGLFNAISTRSRQPELHYQLAGRMKDLALGDAHVVPVDDVISRDQGRDMLVLVVAQSRDSTGRLSGIKMSALSTGLQKVARIAKNKKASVHLPRIGHSTPHFNWYGTERLIRKHLAASGVTTFIYYHPRRSRDKPVTPLLAGTSPTATHSGLLPPGVTPLPDLFTGVCAYLHGHSEQETRRLSRLLIAYNGGVDRCISEKTTHILCAGDQCPAVPTSHSAKILSAQWLKACLREETLVPTEHYTLT